MQVDNEAKVAGGVAGTGTVAGTATAVVGMSAAEMTATLATIGGTVGGGMAAGVVIVAAAPLAIGGLAYLGWKWLRD